MICCTSGGTFFREYKVICSKMCFHSIKWRVEVPSGTTPFMSFTPIRLSFASSQLVPLSIFLKA